ncbi:MAG: NADH-quinone oxidoreductase subunit J, partial [Firmicutes bacterium]|nr:NADH-quinone oxidoreductase subunit J [Bacillota bacterium]
RGIKFWVSPGSGLRKRQPKWIMAAELVETTRLYARCVAQVEPEWIEKLSDIDRWYVAQFSKFLQKLAATPDVDGRTLLDNAMIVYGSGNADGNRHTHDNLPVILAGGPQGLWVADDYLFVADTYNNRIVRFDPVSAWPREDPVAGQISPPMTAVFGQDDFTRGTPNRWDYAEPTNQSFQGPVAGQLVFAVALGSEALGLPAAAPESLEPNTESVGLRLFESYILPFEIASLLLLVAMIGAVLLGKRQKPPRRGT